MKPCAPCAALSRSFVHVLLPCQYCKRFKFWSATCTQNGLSRRAPPVLCDFGFKFRRCLLLRRRQRKTPNQCFATCAQNGFEPAHADINFTRWVATDESYELSDTHELCAFGFPGPHTLPIDAECSTPCT